TGVMVLTSRCPASMSYTEIDPRSFAAWFTAYRRRCTSSPAPAACAAIASRADRTTNNFTRASTSSPPDIRHLVRHHRHEQHIGLGRHIGHVEDALGNVAYSDARLGLDPARGLQPAARGILVAGRRGVADIDLAAGDVVFPPIQ